MDGWKMIVSFWDGLFLEDVLVSGRVYLYGEDLGEPFTPYFVYVYKHNLAQTTVSSKGSSLKGLIQKIRGKNARSWSIPSKKIRFVPGGGFNSKNMSIKIEEKKGGGEGDY